MRLLDEEVEFGKESGKGESIASNEEIYRQSEQVVSGSIMSPHCLLLIEEILQLGKEVGSHVLW